VFQIRRERGNSPDVIPRSLDDYINAARPSRSSAHATVPVEEHAPWELIAVLG
jgi:hypothetical protein